MRGDVACYVAQARAPIDAEIGQKDHSWMETDRLIDQATGRRVKNADPSGPV